MQPLWRLTATDLQQAYRRGTLTPMQVAQAVLQRVDQINPVLNAVVHLRRDGFLADAAASTERFGAGQPLGALDGIPLSVKDNLLTTDMPTTWGCHALREHRAAHDETAVARARGAGALLLGKTNVPEFALEGYTDNRLHGTTRNPWDRSRTPGGSSGGAVAAVAAGICPLALGTDGGGSIRRPASHCGLVGFKPSIGAVARDHALPPLLLDFEVVGPIARTVADAQLLFKAVQGPCAADRASLAAQAAQQPLPAKPRVLYVPTLGDTPVDPQVAASCRRAVLRLQELGAEVQEGALPLNIDFIGSQWPLIGQIGLAALFERHPEWRAEASARFLEMAAQGAAQPASRLWNLLQQIEQLRRKAAQLFSQFDVLVMPSAAALPWPADEVFPSRIAGQTVGPRSHAVFTGWVSVAGLPALALPAEPSAEGLPIGIQLIGNYGSDDAILHLGAAFEALAPWASRWPPL